MQSYNLTIMPMEVELKLNKKYSLQIEKDGIHTLPKCSWYFDACHG